MKKNKDWKNSYHFLSTNWLPHGQIWAIIKGESHPLNANHWVYLSFDPKVTGNLEASLGSQAPSEVWTRNFPIHLQLHISLGHSPWVGLFKMILLIVTSEKYHNIMLIWSLKQVVDFILNFQ